MSKPGGGGGGGHVQEGPAPAGGATPSAHTEWPIHNEG